jgi:MFS family permease
MGRILLGMAISRTGNAMVSVAIVLFSLARYQSPFVAGVVTFASIAPGLLVSPIAGALLDRHGRSKLIVLDLAVAATALLLVGGLALADALPAPLLVAIVAVASLTQPLSATGLRSLFPLLIPRHLWDRANAVDSNGYVIATLIGPPLAGTLVQVIGGPVTLLLVGAVYAISGVVLIGIADPPTDFATTGNLMRDAWEGIRYTLGNPTLRSLAIGLSVTNLAGGVLTLVVPIVLINRLGLGGAVVGLAWAVSGVFGGIAALVTGRFDSRGRERPMLVLPVIGMGLAWTVLLVVPLELPIILVVMAVTGFLNGPLDVALFGLRQRRTDPTWLGRAFAVSMSLNFMGYPIGSAIGGALVGSSVEGAIAFSVVVTVLGGIGMWLTLPPDERPARPFEPAHAPEPAPADPAAPGLPGA